MNTKNSSKQSLDESGLLLDNALLSLAERFENFDVIEEDPLPSDWIQENFYVPEPRDPVTGKVLPPGPILLSELQVQIVNEAFAKKEDGTFKYANVLYSAPKKSGKSALAAAAGMYMAFMRPYSFIYLCANKGSQAKDRIFLPMKTCVDIHHNIGGNFSKLDYANTFMHLPNYTTIQPVPMNAKGEAGSEPTMVIFSEAWGLMTDLEKQLFTEMTIPPTKYGRAIRWIESYAGIKGQSDLLWDLYQQGTMGEKGAYHHPDFPEDIPVFINEDAMMLTYWDTEPRMIWQNEEYYREQARTLVPVEFDRVHRNQWVDSVGAFVTRESWIQCEDENLPELTNNRTSVIVALDAAVTGDCAAAIAVTRHPEYPDTDVAIRDCRIFSPKRRGEINLSEALGETVIEWGKKWNVVAVVYDPYQLEKMAQDFRQGKITISPKDLEGMTQEEQTEYMQSIRRAGQRWFKKFGQNQPRNVADKRLHDMIVSGNISYNPTGPGDIADNYDGKESLTKHILQAGLQGSGQKGRLQKLTDSAKIDAAVALSMAVDVCMGLNLGNNEKNDVHLARQLAKGELTVDEYLTLVKRRGITVK